MNTFRKLMAAATIVCSANSCATVNNGAEPKQAVQESRGEDCERLMLETKKLVANMNDLLIHAHYVKERASHGEGRQALEDRIAIVGGEFQRLENMETQMTQSCMKKIPATDNDFMKMNQIQSAIQRLRLRHKSLKTGQPVEF